MAAVGPNDNSVKPIHNVDKGLLSLDNDSLKSVLSFMPILELTQMASLDGRVKQLALNPKAKEEFDKFLQFVIDTVKDPDIKARLISLRPFEILGLNDEQTEASLRQLRDAVVQIIKDIPELEILQKQYNDPKNFYAKALELAFHYSREHARHGPSQEYLLNTYEREGDIEAIDRMYDLRIPDINVQNLIENVATGDRSRLSSERIIKNIIDNNRCDEAVALAKRIHHRFEEGTYDKNELMCRIVSYLMFKGHPEQAKILLNIWPKEKQLSELNKTLWRIGEHLKSIENTPPEKRARWSEQFIMQYTIREEGVLLAIQMIEEESKKD